MLTDPKSLELYVIAPDLIWKAADYQRLELGKYLVKTELAAFAVGMRDSTRAISATWVRRPKQNLVKNGSFEGFTNTLSALFETTATSDWSALPEAGTTCPKHYIDIQLGTPEIPAAQGKRFMDLNAVCDTNSSTLSSNHRVSQTLPTVKGQLYQVFYSFSGNPKATAPHSFYLDWNDKNRSRATFEADSILHWIEFDFLLVAETNSDKITFQDKVVKAEGFGGLIDNVQVFGLGSGPVP